MTKTPARQHPSYSPKSSTFLNEVRRVMRLKHMNGSLVPTLHHTLRPVLGQAALLSTYPRQRVADEHVDHAGAPNWVCMTTMHAGSSRTSPIIDAFVPRKDAR